MHGPIARLGRYPRRFVVRHPVRAARNSIGNHPSRLANRYLKDLRGVEIGGSSYNSFFLDTLNVDYTDVPANAGLQLRYAGHVLAVDVIASADELPFADGEFDFVLASHVIEHVTDPIRTLKEWVRVARTYVYVVVPDREVFDRDKPLTRWEEQLERYRMRWTYQGDGMTHWSVWSPDSFVEMCTHMGLPVLEVQVPDDKRGNGFAVVLDARAEPHALD